jgi:hypothetical protein
MRRRAHRKVAVLHYTNHISILLLNNIFAGPDFATKQIMTQNAATLANHHNNNHHISKPASYHVSIK